RARFGRVDRSRGDATQTAWDSDRARPTGTALFATMTGSRPSHDRRVATTSRPYLTIRSSRCQRGPTQLPRRPGQVDPAVESGLWDWADRLPRSGRSAQRQRRGRGVGAAVRDRDQDLADPPLPGDLAGRATDQHLRPAVLPVADLNVRPGH